MVLPLKTILFVALGGGIGAVARVWLQTVVKHFYPSIFPFGTLAANAVGCLVIGVLFYVSQKRPDWFWLSPLFMAGFCGGFTTFSSYSLEILTLLQADRPGLAVVYASGSVAAGVGLVYLGYRLAIWAN